MIKSALIKVKVQYSSEFIKFKMEKINYLMNTQQIETNIEFTRNIEYTFIRTWLKGEVENIVRMSNLHIKNSSI